MKVAQDVMEAATLVTPATTLRELAQQLLAVELGQQAALHLLARMEDEVQHDALGNHVGQRALDNVKVGRQQRLDHLNLNVLALGDAARGL